MISIKSGSSSSMLSVAPFSSRSRRSQVTPATVENSKLVGSAAAVEL